MRQFDKSCQLRGSGGQRRGERGHIGCPYNKSDATSARADGNTASLPYVFHKLLSAAAHSRASIENFPSFIGCDKACETTINIRKCSGLPCPRTTSPSLLKESFLNKHGQVKLIIVQVWAEWIAQEKNKKDVHPNLPST
ncbi:hypothetical protein CRG98_048532 [Punica granatum]|uniref:Uncharacterized protein n=1 Tax=Punica granatum TaxID=22663 RepID=A0A2I0HHB1_PUNGR|nr:hypothetical protein CRG98_048532 [Punica granatum]